MSERMAVVLECKHGKIVAVHAIGDRSNVNEAAAYIAQDMTETDTIRITTAEQVREGFPCGECIE